MLDLTSFLNHHLLCMSHVSIHVSARAKIPFTILWNYLMFPLGFQRKGNQNRNVRWACYQPQTTASYQNKEQRYSGHGSRCDSWTPDWWCSCHNVRFNFFLLLLSLLRCVVSVIKECNLIALFQYIFIRFYLLRRKTTTWIFLRFLVIFLYSSETSLEQKFIHKYMA